MAIVLSGLDDEIGSESGARVGVVRIKSAVSGRGVGWVVFALSSPSS